MGFGSFEDPGLVQRVDKLLLKAYVRTIPTSGMTATVPRDYSGTQSRAHFSYFDKRTWAVPFEQFATVCRFSSTSLVAGPFRAVCFLFPPIL